MKLNMKLLLVLLLVAVVLVSGCVGDKPAESNGAQITATVEVTEEPGNGQAPAENGGNEANGASNGG